ncbi:MAG: class SAM-dependent methyltransferase [Solirubrobacteraceae bacterium]|nr:class SAM-dependent methyltransferase [Solirubrobacteraceae bacterium]
MASIGPTAHFTGQVWAANGLSHPELTTIEGRVMHAAASPAQVAGRLARLPTLEGALLARHLVIDALLEDAIAAGTVGQVLEVAAGMSPRGWRFAERHPDLLYVEADLPDMAARKRAALARIGRPASHRVVELDALTQDGPLSLASVAAGLEPGRGLAIITEGLLSYLPRDAVLALWRGFAETIAAFPGGVYLSDLHVDADTPVAAARAFEAALSALVRTKVSVHFDTADEARDALLAAGFSEARVFPAGEHPAAPSRPGANRVRIVQASGSPTAS